MEGDTPHGGTNRHTRLGVTLENSSAIWIWLESPAPTSIAVIVWRDGPKKNVHPKPVEPLRDIQPDDVVIVHAERRIVKSVEAWR